MKRPRFTRRTVLVLVVVLLLLAASGAGLASQRARARVAAVVAALPPRPELNGWPAEFGNRLESCERRARAGENSVEALGELSRLLHANGFLPEAAQCYVALEQLDPGNARWAHRHATIHAGYGQADAAIALWEHVIKRVPDYLPARLRMADLLLKTNQLEAARTAYEDVLTRSPDEPYAHLGLARCDVETERWDAARTRLEKLVAQTQYQLGYDLIVTVYERLGLEQNAANVRGQMMASGAYRDYPDPWVDELYSDSYDLYQLALTAGMAERSGDITTAVRRLERALSLDPQNHSLHFQLGLTYQKSNDIGRARQHLEKATALDPTFADAWAHLSSLHAAAGDQASADRLLAQGLRHNPGSFGLRLMRGRRLKDAERYAEAAQEYQLAVAARPNSPDGYIELALTYLRIGEVSAGVENLKRALIAEPEHPTALTTLGLHAIGVGDETDARHWIERARAQPRVRRDHLQTLERNFQAKFGRLP